MFMLCSRESEKLLTCGIDSEATPAAGGPIGVQGHWVEAELAVLRCACTIEAFCEPLDIHRLETAASQLSQGLPSSSSPILGGLRARNPVPSAYLGQP